MRKFNVKVTLKNGEQFEREMSGNTHENILDQVKALCFDPNELKFVLTEEIFGRTAEQVEAEIERINENQKYQVIEEGGGNVHHTAQFFTNLAKLERLYDELDEMA